MEYDYAMNTRLVVPASALAALAFSLTACGGSVPADGNTVDLEGSGDLVSFKTTDGLACDVFDTTQGGGADCNFDAFTVPSSWKPGEVDRVPVADGEALITYFADGHYCVTFDGTKSGSIECAYPAR